MKKYVENPNSLTDEEYWDEYYNTEEADLDDKAEFVMDIAEQIFNMAGADMGESFDEIARIIDEMYPLAQQLQDIIHGTIY